MRLYLRTRDARSNIHCCRNTKLHFRDKDDAAASKCNNINARVRHYSPCNATRLDFRQELNCT